MLWEELALAIRRTNYLRSQDKALGRDETFVLLHEVMAVKDRETGNGYLVRDLRPLEDGHRWLPAFSIPQFDTRIGEVYAKSMGRAKARLLLRYGLQLLQPNPQNFLMQLDLQGKPTGVIAIRDLSDQAIFVDWMAETIGAKGEVQKDRDTKWSIPLGGKPHPPEGDKIKVLGNGPSDKVNVESVLNPRFGHGFMYYEKEFRDGGKLKRKEVVDWIEAEKWAYFDEIVALTGLKIARPAKADFIPEILDKALNSETGLRAVRGYHQRLRTATTINPK